MGHHYWKTNTKGKISMNIAIILFTYNRSRHTKAVLDALSENTILPQTLYLFQDGRRASTNIEEWEAVSNLIKTVSWCDTKVIISDKNKGLAKSIKTGVDYVFQLYDAVIVLEDDCVPHPQFMEYMVKALEKYEKNKEVYHIGASSEPVSAEQNGTDAYFLGRINSCGWGTWKDRWQQFSNDYTMIGKIKADSEMSGRLKLWGEDLESHILGNIYGETDSWAVFWALTVIVKNGYCLSPYESLINNIGFDGTGVHSGIAENTLKLRPYEKRSEIILPDKIEWVKNYKYSFSAYHIWTSPAVKNEYYKNVVWNILELQKKGRRISEYLKKRNINNLIVWGKGQLCDYLIDDLRGEITINAIVETVSKGEEYRGIPILHWEKIPKEIPLIIVVPGYDIDRIVNVMQYEELKRKVISIDYLIDMVRV
jgi:hypothetical protein